MLTVNGVDIPEIIDEILIPVQTAHVIIDFQNDYCHPDGLAARNGGDLSSYASAIEVASDLTEQTRRLGVLQIFVRMITLANGASDSPAWLRMNYKVAMQRGDRLSGQFAPVCVAGTWGAALVDQLAPTRADVTIDKARSSAFFDTELFTVLRSKQIKTLIVSGCTTEGCVESTVRDAGFRDYFPIVSRDSVCSDVPALHEASLTVMSAYRADVVAAGEIVDVLRRNRRPHQSAVSG
jgi:nicotinamidase-related amidase